MADRYAVIDLGTNTFHLLIAELEHGKLRQLYAEKTGVRLGKAAPEETGGINAGQITPSAQARGLAAMQHFSRKLADFGLQPGQALAFGTSALRSATNGKAVADLFTANTGIAVNIIDGLTEADLIYNGVRHSYDFGSGTAMIMDIGGGSVEFIIANQEKTLWQQSFEIGGQRLMDLFMQTDPISEEGETALYQWLDQQLTPLWEAVALHKPQTLIGSAGTFETLADMCFFKLEAEHKPFEEQTWEELPLKTIRQLAIELKGLNREERLKVPGMIELRADMSVVAMLLLQFVLNKTGITHVVASVYALKEGVFFRLATAK